MLSAVSGSPPIAKTSESALAAAIWPNRYGSSTIGREEVDRLHEREIVGQHEDPRVVEGLAPNDQPRIRLHREAAQRAREVTRTQLGGSTGAARERVRRKSSSRVFDVVSNRRLIVDGVRNSGVGASRSWNGDDGVDLDEHAARQRRHLHRRARRARIAECLAVHLVHDGEIVHVVQEYRRLHDVLPRRADGGEHRGEIRHDALGLRGTSPVTI